MRVETKTFTVYIISQEEHTLLEEAGLFDLLLRRLNRNERIEIE